MSALYVCVCVWQADQKYFRNWIVRIFMLQTAKHTRRHTHTHTCLSSTHTLTHKTSKNSSIEFCSAFSAPPPFNRYAPFKQFCSRLPPPLCSPQRVQRQQPTACSVCLLKCPLCVLSQTSENTNSNANKPDVRISWRPSSTFGIVLQSNLVGCSCADGLCSCPGVPRYICIYVCLLELSMCIYLWVVFVQLCSSSSMRYSIPQMLLQLTQLYPVFALHSNLL